MRRQHLVRRGLARGRDGARARRRHGDQASGPGAAGARHEAGHLLLTHLHLDHVEGLRFFAPLWGPADQGRHLGSPSPLLSLRERISRSFSPPLFPIDLRHVPAQVEFMTSRGSSGRSTARCCRRISSSIQGRRSGTESRPGPRALRTCRIMSRRSPGPSPSGPPTGSPEPQSPRTSTCSFTMLSTPRTNTKSESAGATRASRTRWRLRAVRARRLLLFHHEPAHADGLLEDLEARAQSLMGEDEISPTLAREGMVVELP